MNTRYKSALASAALALTLALAPLSSFASDGNNGNHNGWEHAFFANVSAWFNGHFGIHNAYAETKTDPAPNRAPSISGITAPTVLEAGSEGTWVVNASDPENGSLSYSVDWGDTNAFMRMFASAAAFTQSSTFTHTYDKAGDYTVKFTVKDDGGKTSMSSATVHVTAAAEPFALSDVKASVTDSTSATVTWKTNMDSNSRVFYNTETPVDISSAASVKDNGSVSDHSLNLTGLTPDTKYYFVVKSKDADGDIVTSDEMSFQTPPTPNGAPKIESFSGPAALAVDEDGTWTVNASDPENGSLSYSIDWGDTAGMARMLAAMAPSFTQTSTFTHSYSEAGTYTITLTAKDDAGNTVTSQATVDVSAANAAPHISGITALVGDNSVGFKWTTNESADSEVYYSASSPVTIGDSATTAVTDSTMGTDHSVNVSGLSSGTTYYFLIQSKDADGANTATSEFSLTTMGM